MAKEESFSITDEEYRKFIKERLANTDYNAANKLKRIDLLGDLIFTARENYRKKI